MKTILINLQFAMFFKNIVSRPDVTFGRLNESLLNLFDGMPSILPIPPQAPPEIPLMTLQSEGGAYACNIARSRIDLSISRLNDEKSNDEIFKDFNAKVPAFSKFVLQEVEVIRFGLVARYFSSADDSTLGLKKKYFTSKIGDVNELSLRYNAPSKFNGWTINDVVEISAGVSAVIDNLPHKGLHIQRDINNVAADKGLSLQDLEKISAKYSGRVSEKSIQELLP